MSGKCKMILLLLSAAWMLPGREGSLLIIGGALSPENQPVYRQFIRAGGGTDRIRIAIVPGAGNRPVSSAQSYRADFIAYGVDPGRIRIFPLAVMDDPGTPDQDESKWFANRKDARLARDLGECSAVFLTGGDQVRLRDLFLDSRGEPTFLLDALHRVLARGGVIAGTSAGAAAVSDPMICRGDPLLPLFFGAQLNAGCTEDERQVQLTRGLGLARQILFDQHFNQRCRIGRLIASLAALPERVLGVGIDENTAVFLQGSRLRVLGESEVTVVSLAAKETDEIPHRVKIVEARLAVLSGGQEFLLNREALFTGAGEPVPFPPLEKTTLIQNLMAEKNRKGPVSVDFSRGTEGWSFILTAARVFRIIRIQVKPRRWGPLTGAWIRIRAEGGGREGDEKIIK